MNKTEVNFDDLVGKIITKVSQRSDRIIFKTSDGEVYSLQHDQECCENVELDDVCGDLDDLINEKIIKFYEVQDKKTPLKPEDIGKEDVESHTWAFYHISTLSSHITIKFYGISNGIYSETANLYKIDY